MQAAQLARCFTLPPAQRARAAPRTRGRATAIAARGAGGGDRRRSGRPAIVPQTQAAAEQGQKHGEAKAGEKRLKKEVVEDTVNSSRPARRTTRSQTRATKSRSWLTSSTRPRARPGAQGPGEMLAAGPVEIVGRLVEQHQIRRRVEDRPKRQVLALAAGKFVGAGPDDRPASPAGRLRRHRSRPGVPGREGIPSVGRPPGSAGRWTGRAFPGGRKIPGPPARAASSVDLPAPLGPRGDPPFSPPEAKSSGLTTGCFQPAVRRSAVSRVSSTIGLDEALYRLVEGKTDRRRRASRRR